MDKFKDLKEILNKKIKNPVFEIINNDKLETPLLLTAFKVGGNFNILLFDGGLDLSSVGMIAFSNNGNRLNLSVFEIDEEYQQKGLGKLLFQVATCYGDITGATKLYGEANPTNNIKGVSNGNNFEEEVKAIISIYKKLGCEFKNDDNFFELNWKPGEKVDQSDELIRSIAYNIAEKNGFEKPKQFE